MLALAQGGPADAGPLAHAPCPDAATPMDFVANQRDLENLHFHGGRLHITGSDGFLRTYDVHGTETRAVAVGARSGAMVTLDGDLYVRVGSDPGEVWKVADDGTHTTVATGLDGANGMAVDAAGNLYVSDEPGGRIYKLPAGDLANWTVWTVLDWPNGLVVDDDAGVLYAAMTVDGRSSILAIDLLDPSHVTEVAHLSFGAFSANVFWGFSDFSRVPVEVHDPSDPAEPVLFKALDDLTLASDGFLYAAAWWTGEVLRVDPATGEACAVATGLDQPSSVRVAEGFGAFDGDLFVTDFGGYGQLFGDTPAHGKVRIIPLGP